MAGSRNDDFGEDYYSYSVGGKGVTKIEEHLPQGEGDLYYCLVSFEDGHHERIMNLNMVISGKHGF